MTRVHIREESEEACESSQLFSRFCFLLFFGALALVVAGSLSPPLHTQFAMTQTITLKVSIDCDACKRKVKKALDGIEGVETIDVDMKNERVTVVGSVEPKVLVKRLAKVGKKVELPGGYAKGDYNNNNDNINNSYGKGGNKNKGGSKGKVASADMDPNEEMPTTEVYANIFSDENANSCSVM